MYFRYGDNKRPEVRSETTFEAILAGERFSTLRKPQWYNGNTQGYFYLLKRLKEDASIKVWEGRKVGRGRSVTVRLTHPPIFLDEPLTDELCRQISRTEGWTVDYLKRNGYFKTGVLYLRYKPLSN